MRSMQQTLPVRVFRKLFGKNTNQPVYVPFAFKVKFQLCTSETATIALGPAKKNSGAKVRKGIVYVTKPCHFVPVNEVDFKASKESFLPQLGKKKEALFCVSLQLDSSLKMKFRILGHNKKGKVIQKTNFVLKDGLNTLNWSRDDDTSSLSFDFETEGRGTFQVGDISIEYAPFPMQKLPFGNLEVAPSAKERAISQALEWLRQSHLCVTDGGSAGYYKLEKSAWGGSYMETTGYILTTFVEARKMNVLPEDFDLIQAKMVDFLLKRQLPDGSFEGGQTDKVSEPNVFVTAQVLDGYASLLKEKADSKILKAAEASADWIVNHQSPEGYWQKGAWDQDVRTYLSRVAWPVAMLIHTPGVKDADKYRRSTRAFCEWMLTKIQPNQWIDGWGFFGPKASKESNIVHPIAYAIEGLLECAAILEDSKFLSAALNVSRKVGEIFERDGTLWGEYNSDWSPGGHYICITGNAQMARIWGRAYELSGDAYFKTLTLKMCDQVRSLQIGESGPEHLRGGFAGSFPVSGRYQKFQILNWAAKFSLDAFLVEKRISSN